MSCPLGAITTGLILQVAACRSTVDVAAAARALLDADRNWARLADAGTDADSIVAYWTSDALVILPSQGILLGTDALRQMVEGTRNIPGFHITWTPDSAVVAPSGDFGYTYGTNLVTAPNATGQLTTTEGRYVTVWRKDPAGHWRCAVDIYNEGPTAAAEVRQGTA